MADPLASNRLDDEESPYLRQHADNPVRWQPWDDAALAGATAADRPIFLSIGYAACHWCHVMADESFDDPTVAEILNDQYVAIKVDREERPDLDAIYQTICQLVTGRGGWPLSVWLTPDGQPFYVGTYFPRESRHGLPAFPTVLTRLHEAWEDDRAAIEDRADQWTAAIEGELEDVPSQPTMEADADLLQPAAAAALRGADREYGGFGTSGPKFPQPTRLRLLWTAYERTDRDAYRNVVLETLDAMATGGLYDQLGGGFHRYSTDRTWTVPHFEKMLYDNAEIPRSYITTLPRTDDPRYRAVVSETLDFVNRELRHPDGGFYSTLDAQSEGEEGTFYVWTPDSIESTLDDAELAALCHARYGVTASGNFAGASVLTIAATIDELAADFELAPDEVRYRLETATERLLAAREERPRPSRDEKILAGWNGLLISMLARASPVIETDTIGPATEALSFIREHLWNGETGRLMRRYADGVVRIDGYLEDYAFLARGAFDCYQLGGDVAHLAFAFDLADAMIDRFWDDTAGTMYFTPDDAERLIVRPQERADQSTPSSLGVAIDVLLGLSLFQPTDEYRSIVERVLSTHRNRIRSSPLEHGTLVLVNDRLRAGDIELTVVGDRVPNDWYRVVSAATPGDPIVAPRPADASTFETWLDRLDVDSVPPIWANRDGTDDDRTGYLCRSFTCSPPLSSIEEVRQWCDEFGEG